MIYIVRHGQTQKNKQKTLQGRSDIPLNETGRQQAEEAGRFLRELGVKPHRIYSSPLIRAVETAELIRASFDDAPADRSSLDIVTDERLIEMDYGPYEGMDLTDPSPEVMAFFMDFAGTPAPEGMEQLSSVVARAGRFLEEIISEARNGDIIISTHAIAMKGLLEYMTPGSEGSYWSTYVGNCEIYAADVTERGFDIPHSVSSSEETPGV